jgi:hypothetical protein
LRPFTKGYATTPRSLKLVVKAFYATCAAPVGLAPAFTEPIMYRRDDAKCKGPTLMIRQVDNILCGAEHASDRNSFLDGIGSKVTFKRSDKLTSLFYATDIEQCAQYIRIYARSCIESCLAKLDWEAQSAPTHMMIPLTPMVLKSLNAAPCPLDPAGIAAMATKYGFQYRTMTGMLIFAVQIGRFDVGPAVCVLSKFNERPNDVHFQAAKLVLEFLRSTIYRGLIYWRPTGRERPDLPRGNILPIRPNIQPLQSMRSEKYLAALFEFKRIILLLSIFPRSFYILQAPPPPMVQLQHIIMKTARR